MKTNSIIKSITILTKITTTHNALNYHLYNYYYITSTNGKPNITVTSNQN